MSRKYEKVKELLPVVLHMMEQGKTQREIANELTLENVKVVKNLLYRYRHGTQFSRSRRRKPAKTLQEYKYENKRLKMENELLRDFLSLIGKE